MNYQLKHKEILDNLKGTPKLLLHACCGPCSSYVLEYLSEYFQITILYYNPNIYPDIEYQRRYNELKDFLLKRQYKNKINLVEITYKPAEFYHAVEGLELLGEKSKRCYECYKLRLEKTVEYAKQNNFDYFTTTLSISPYKVSDWINEIGESLEKKYDVKYLYADFKKNNGYKRSLELSYEYNMYRQDYCGCSFSKNEKEKMELENKHNSDFVNKICKIYNIGDLINIPIRLKGGITNKVLKFKTTKGEYVVKILYSKLLQEIELSEMIANEALSNGINAIGALKYNSKYINNIDGINFLIYEFYSGKILLTKELSLEHVKKLARELGKLHSIDCPLKNDSKKYSKIDFQKYYDLTKDNLEIQFKLFNDNITNLKNIYDKVYNSYLHLSNQNSYIHRDFNRRNVLWKDINNFKIIDFETATIGNPSIDFFNSAWFLTDDIKKDKFNVFVSEYFKYMDLDDDYSIGIYAALIEECNWLEFSLKRALKLINCTKEEVNLGINSIESSLNEILNYYNKIDKALSLLENITKNR